MHNLVKYADYAFDDSSILGGSLLLQNSLMFDKLEADVMSINIISDDLGNRKLFTKDLAWYSTADGKGYVIYHSDIRKFKYGDLMEYYHEGQLEGKFHITSIERLGKRTFKLNCCSMVGLWVNMQHLGGVYFGITVGELFSEILGPDPGITIDPDVAGTTVYGYLPVSNARDNIQQILFAVGASIVKNADGTPRVRFLKDLETIEVDDRRIYLGGTIKYKSPATIVSVTEHSYYESILDKEVTLFDNTDGGVNVENKLVTFSNPVHDLLWNGAPIPASWGNGANYCYVTGVGVLTGKEYTHAQRIFTVETGAGGETKVVSIENATLVSSVNSANVSARIADYQKSAEEVKTGIVLTDDNICPGSLISFTDPYGEDASGIVASMRITMSKTLKADTSVIKGYTPGYFGNNYQNVVIFTEDTTWTPPEGTERIRFVVAQGGQAGQNGFQGASSYKYGGTFGDDNQAPGEGGAEGKAGLPGMVNVVDVADVSGSYRITVGDGGAPGEGSGAIGNEGEHSTVTGEGVSITSADGAIPDEGYREIIEGETYATIGRDGIPGARGGETGGYGAGRKGSDLTYEGETWEGGKGSTEIIKTTNHQSGGGSGGGAAYGAAGNDGEPASYNSLGNATGGKGGRGADAQQIPYTPTLAGGGQGGCGGGGGGCSSVHRNRRSSSADWGGYNWGTMGPGGAFSLGGFGGKGFVAAYY